MFQSLIRVQMELLFFFFLENYFKSFLGPEIKEYSSYESVQDSCLK